MYNRKESNLKFFFLIEKLKAPRRTDETAQISSQLGREMNTDSGRILDGKTPLIRFETSVNRSESSSWNFLPDVSDRIDVVEI